MESWIITSSAMISSASLIVGKCLQRTGFKEKLDLHNLDLQ